MAEGNGKSNGLDFSDLEPIEVPVKLKVGNEVRNYILREANTEAARQYRNANAQSYTMVNGQLAGLGAVADPEGLLVSLCLFPVGPDGVVSPKHVSLDFVRQQNSKITKSLFEKLLEISEVGQSKEEQKKDEEQAGNVLSGTAVG